MAGKLVGRNLTDFFNKELLMYALGDIKLSRPIPLKKVGIGLIAFVVWTGSFLFFFEFTPSVWWFLFALGPPLLFTNFVSKPIFGGKRLIDFLKTMYNYILQPKGWSDLYEDNTQQNTVYFIEQEISISRRRELNYLSRLAREQSLEKEQVGA